MYTYLKMRSILKEEKPIVTEGQVLLGRRTKIVLRRADVAER